MKHVGEMSIKQLCNITERGKQKYWWKTVRMPLYLSQIPCEMGHAVALWLRHYATNRQVAGSIPDGVTGIFQ